MPIELRTHTIEEYLIHNRKHYIRVDHPSWVEYQLEASHIQLTERSVLLEQANGNVIGTDSPRALLHTIVARGLRL